MLLLASACNGSQGGYPPVADISAVTESKPLATEAILTDPVAEANHNASIEGWGDRLHSAGVRLCRFYKETGMTGVSCPKR